MAEWQRIIKMKIDDLGGGVDGKVIFSNNVDLDIRTVERYLAGKNRPTRKDILERLETYVPEIGPALRKEFPAFYEAMEEEVRNLVAPFYSRVHEALEYLDQAEAFRPISKMILDLMVNHLDPDGLIGEGVVALLGQLGVPQGQNKASFLEMHAWSCQGTGIWFEDSVHQSYIAGKDSLGAVALNQGEVALYPRDISSLITKPITHKDQIKSAAAHPIRKNGRYAGVIYIASTQPNYFTRYRREVVTHYARMLSLVFFERQFFLKEQMDMGNVMDNIEQQYLDQLALSFPGEPRERLKNMAIERFRELL